VIQDREDVEEADMVQVLSDFARRRHITWREASQLARDVLFNNSNRVYHLGLVLNVDERLAEHRRSIGSSDLDLLEAFLEGKREPSFLRIYWNDFTAMPRMRAVPLRRVLNHLREDGDFSIGLTKACLGLLQNDAVIPGLSPTGEFRLHPDFTSLVQGPGDNNISAFGDFRELNGSYVPVCPRSLLQRIVDLASRRGFTFQVGFEVELVLFHRRVAQGQETYTTLENDGHAWSVSRMMDHYAVSDVLEPAIEALASQGIYIEQLHPESAPGQFEISLPPSTPLEAVDTLLHVRDVLSHHATRNNYRMSLHPKPFPSYCGNAAHAHLSISSVGGDKPEVYEPFYAGILKHLRAICAFTYSNGASYDRLQDGFWAGGRHVTWGTQNRETPLRKIEGSHWEVKCFDGLANPYLALSALLAGGMIGIKNELPLTWGDCEVDPASLTENDRRELNVEEMLPLALDEALAALGQDEELIGLLGEELVERYVAVKEAEAKFLASLTEQERREWIIARY